MPTQDQLTKFRLNRVQHDRCQTINVLQFNVDDYHDTDVEQGLKCLSVVQNRTEWRKAQKRAWTPITHKQKCTRFMPAMDDKRHKHDGNKERRLEKYLASGKK